MGQVCQVFLLLFSSEEANHFKSCLLNNVKTYRLEKIQCIPSKKDNINELVLPQPS